MQMIYTTLRNRKARNNILAMQCRAVTDVFCFKIIQLKKVSTASTRMSASIFLCCGFARFNAHYVSKCPKPAVASYSEKYFGSRQ